MLYGYLGRDGADLLRHGGAGALAARLGGAAHRADPARLRPGRLAQPAGGGRAEQPRPAARRPQLGPAGRPATPGVRAMRGYQFAATRLALLRDGMLRGLDRKPGRPGADRAGGAGAAGRDHRVPVVLRRSGPAGAGGRLGRQRYHLRFPDGTQRAGATRRTSRWCRSRWCWPPAPAPAGVRPARLARPAPGGALAAGAPLTARPDGDQARRRRLRSVSTAVRKSPRPWDIAISAAPIALNICAAPSGRKAMK